MLNAGCSEQVAPPTPDLSPPLATLAGGGERGRGTWPSLNLMRIIEDDLSDARVLDLLRIHLAGSRANTAPGSAHALDVAGLQSPGIGFWTIWQDDALLGCGALKQLSSDHGEIKSMHTEQAARRNGVGSAMLRHIVATSAHY